MLLLEAVGLPEEQPSPFNPRPAARSQRQTGPVLSGLGFLIR